MPLCPSLWLAIRIGAASKGHRIIQCGPMGMAALVVSNGSVLLRCVAPQSMYAIPGTVLVGFGFPALTSANHCMATGSAHIGGSPIMFSLPGVQTHLFVPWRSTFLWPAKSVSTTVCVFRERGRTREKSASDLGVDYIVLRRFS